MQAFDSKPAAGIVASLVTEDAKSCLAPLQRQSSTPAVVKRFRRTEDPGVKTVHWGLADAKLPPAGFAYGRKTYGSEHVEDMFKSQQFSGFGEFRQEVHERVYASSYREPLGRSLQRGHVLPRVVSQPNFRFGVAQTPGDSAKDVIAPKGGSVENSAQTAAQYFKSHGITQAGEQLSRNYQWPFDPREHRFGLRDVVKSSEDPLQPALQKTQITARRNEEFRQTVGEMLGKSRNLGTGVRVPPDYSFGKLTMKPEWTAGQCITGEPRPEALLPDRDLGKTVRKGFRNIPKPGDEDRQFGVPSVRYDLPKRSQRSITDAQNYGDDATAVEVMFPDNWLRYGLSPDEMVRGRDKEEIRDLLQASGVNPGRGQFEAIHSKAQRTAGQDRVSLRDWATAYQWFVDRALIDPIK